MEKINSKNLKAFGILLGISIFLASLISFIIKGNGNLIFRLSNNLFAIATFFLSIGVIFQVFNYALKRRIKRKLKEKDNKKIKKPNFKDSKRLEVWQYKQDIYNSLWKVFIMVGVVDIGLSFIVLMFI